MEWRATLDRFEGGTAVLLPGKRADRVLIARELLPPGAREGSILSIRIRLDDAAAAADKLEIERLQAELEKT